MNYERPTREDYRTALVALLDALERQTPRFHVSLNVIEAREAALRLLKRDTELAELAGRR